MDLSGSGISLQSAPPEKRKAAKRECPFRRDETHLLPPPAAGGEYTKDLHNGHSPVKTVSYGTDEAIERIVEEYSPMLLRLACTRLGSTADAEDAVQEVFLQLLSSPMAFRDAGHEKAWLIRATLHRASDIRRRAERKNIPLDEAYQVPAPGPADPDQDSTLEAVRSLPEKYSAVLYLHYYEGYTAKEIGKLLGLPAATVGTRLARGREKLRQTLKEEPT